jgi:hypothetical protein
MQRHSHPLDIAEEPEDELTDTEDNRVTGLAIHAHNRNNNLYKASVVNTIHSWKESNNVGKSSNNTTTTALNGNTMVGHNSTTTTSQFDPRHYSNLVLVNNKNHNNQLQQLQKSTTSTAAGVQEQKLRNNANNYEYTNGNKAATTATATTIMAHNRNDRMRIFVALFDYDPPTMSPNPDACDEELPFREGQLIKVYGEKDSDGFYWGEAGGKVGFVPCNMVSEVQVRK